MSDDIKIIPKHFFQIVEGSNYEVLMTYGVSEVIEFEQFQKLATAILKGTSDFITVNNLIVQKKDIKMIRPTTLPTQKKREVGEKKRAEEEEKRKQKERLLGLKLNFEASFYNAKLGQGKWSKFTILHLHPELVKECWTKFVKGYPEAENILKNN